MLISGVLQLAIFHAHCTCAQYCSEHYNIFILIDPFVNECITCYHTTLYEFQSYFVDDLYVAALSLMSKKDLLLIILN